MKSPLGHVRVATRSDWNVLTGMIREQYISLDDFEVHNPNCLMYDMSAVVLVAVLASGEIVSAMQGKMIGTVCELESATQCEIPRSSFKSPAVMITRAVTHSRYRRLGLSALLYFHFVSMAIKQGGTMAISTIYDSGPWVAHMKRLGFSLLTPSREWQSHVINKRPVLLAILEQENLSRYVALEGLETNLQSYPWSGDIPTLT